MTFSILLLIDPGRLGHPLPPTQVAMNPTPPADRQLQPLLGGKTWPRWNAGRRKLSIKVLGTISTAFLLQHTWGARKPPKENLLTRIGLSLRILVLKGVPLVDIVFMVWFVYRAVGLNVLFGVLLFLFLLWTGRFLAKERGRVVMGLGALHRIGNRKFYTGRGRKNYYIYIISLQIDMIQLSRSLVGDQRILNISSCQLEDQRLPCIMQPS